MPAVATTIYKVRAVADFLAQTSEQVSFRRGQAFYVLAADSETGMYFVSTQYATPFSRTSVSGLVPIRNFEVVDLMSKDPPLSKSNAEKQKEKEKEREREKEQKEKEREREKERLKKEREGTDQVREKGVDRWVPEEDTVSPLREDDDSPKDIGFRRKGSLLVVAAANNSKNDPMSTSQSTRFPRPFGAPRAPSEEDLRRKFNSQIEFRKHPDSAKRNFDPRQSTSSTVSNVSTNSSTRAKINSLSIRSSINSMISRNSLQDSERTRKLLEEHSRQFKMRYQLQQNDVETITSLDKNSGLRPNERPFFNPPPLLRGKIDLVAWDLLVHDQIAEIFVLGMLERTSQHPPRFQMQVTRQKHTHIVARTFGDIYFLHRTLVGEFEKPAERNIIPPLPESLTGGISEMRSSQDFDTKLHQYEKEISAYMSKFNGLPLYILDSFSVLRFFAPINFAEMELTGNGIRRNSFSRRDSYLAPHHLNSLRKQRPLSRSSSTSSLNFDSKISGSSSIQRTLGVQNMSRRSSMMFDQVRFQNSPQTSMQKRLNSAGDADEENASPSNINSMYVNHGSVYQPLSNGTRYNRSLSRKSSTNFNIEIYSNSNSPSPPRDSDTGIGVTRGLGAPAPPPDSSPTDSLLSPAPILSPPPSARRFSRQTVYQPKERSLIPRTNFHSQSKSRINGHDTIDNSYKRDSSYGRGDMNLSSSQSIRKVLAGRIAAAAAAKQAAEALIGSTAIQADIGIPGSGKLTPASLPIRRGSGDESFDPDKLLDDYTGQDKSQDFKIGNYPSSSLPSSLKNISALARDQANAIRRRSSSGNELLNFQTKNGTLSSIGNVKEVLAARQQHAATLTQRAALVQRERERERERDRLAALSRQQALAQESQMQRFNNQQNEFQSRQNSSPDRRSITPDRTPSLYRSPPSPNSKNVQNVSQVKPFVATLNKSVSSSALKVNDEIFSSPTRNKNIEMPSDNENQLSRNPNLSRIPAPMQREYSQNQDMGTLKGRANINGSNGPSVTGTTPAFQRVTDFGTRGSSLQNRTVVQKLPQNSKTSKA